MELRPVRDDPHDSLRMLVRIHDVTPVTVIREVALSHLVVLARLVGAAAALPAAGAGTP